MTRISATEASRRFSNLLDRVRHDHESFLIVRRGQAVARLDAVESADRGLTLDDLVRALAPMRTGDPTYADDLEEIQREQPTMSEEPWPS